MSAVRDWAGLRWLPCHVITSWYLCDKFRRRKVINSSSHRWHFQGLAYCRELAVWILNLSLTWLSLAGKFSGKADPVTGLEYAAVNSRGRHEQCIGWVDKPLFSRDGSSLVFVYHVGRCKAGSGASSDSSSYLFTVNADGTGLWRCGLGWQNVATDLYGDFVRHQGLCASFGGRSV